MTKRYKDGYRAKRNVVDPARLAAYKLLNSVRKRDSYANLELPKILADLDLRGRDAGFATELGYGALRLQGRHDAIIERCLSRPLSQVDPDVLDILRLGVHQLHEMRVPAHAALAETVDLARYLTSAGPAGLVNAVLRAVTRREKGKWLAELEAIGGDKGAGIYYSHPMWMVRALREALAGHKRPPAEITEMLAANNESPEVVLVARPGLISPADLADEVEEILGSQVAPGDVSWHSVLISGGDPAALPSIRNGRAGVQDEGSQFVADLLANAPLSGPDKKWLDLCAGPGGKAALLGALAKKRGAHLVANEVTGHRADLVRQAVRALGDSVEVRNGDGRDFKKGEEKFDRILVDAPCSGLGALRRRPEARWRKQPRDIADLVILQEELLEAALAVLRPGGLLGYVTCSPLIAETKGVVERIVNKHDEVEVIDAGALADKTAPTPIGATGPYIQLWPHLHATDAMFLALIRKNG